jgi:hypothetical protein
MIVRIYSIVGGPIIYRECRVFIAILIIAGSIT